MKKKSLSVAVVVGQKTQNQRRVHHPSLVWSAAHILISPFPYPSYLNNYNRIENF